MYLWTQCPFLFLLSLKNSSGAYICFFPTGVGFGCLGDERLLVVVQSLRMGMPIFSLAQGFVISYETLEVKLPLSGTRYILSKDPD